LRTALSEVSETTSWLCLRENHHGDVRPPSINGPKRFFLVFQDHHRV
jgi:hypothetical protein